ncbi:MAG TPA: class I SAM-dependent methyltransferase, partial [Roseiflexaceae bacterium]|nr:class I SAM-dependent methyltransferase [Roseiflexaceae bacterium]
MTHKPGDWGNQNTDVFVDIGRYAVPEREWQIAMFCDLIPPRSTPFTIVELCCGEGLLAEALLARFPHANLLALDGSPAMLERTTRRLHSYAGRASTRQFDLASHEWRAGIRDAGAVVSSLAIHHLDDA